MGWRPSLQKEVQNAGQYLKPAHCSVLLVLGQDADPGSPRRREVQPGGTRLPLRHRRKNLCFSPRPRSWRPQKTRGRSRFPLSLLPVFLCNFLGATLSRHRLRRRDINFRAKDLRTPTTRDRHKSHSTPTREERTASTNCVLQASIAASSGTFARALSAPTPYTPIRLP